MKLRLNGFFGLVFLAIAYALDTGGVFPYFLISALWHEAGHIIAIYACGGKIRGLEAVPFGLCMRFDGLMGYGCDAVIAAGGGAGNLAAAFMLSVAAKYLPCGEILNRAAGAMLMVGISSLIPALPLDGGRVVYALLAKFANENAAYRITRTLSLALGTGLAALGVYILVKTRYNMSILAVGAVIIGGVYAKGNRKDIAARA